MTEESDDAPNVKMGLGQVVQVEIDGTKDETTEETVDRALDAVDELAERYHNLNEEERARRAEEGNSAPPIGGV